MHRLRNKPPRHLVGCAPTLVGRSASVPHVLPFLKVIYSPFPTPKNRGAGASVGVGMLRGRRITLIENKKKFKVSKFQKVKVSK